MQNITLLSYRSWIKEEFFKKIGHPKGSLSYQRLRLINYF